MRRVSRWPGQAGWRFTSRTVRTVLASLAVALSIGPIDAFGAERTVSMSASVGLNGFYSKYTWVPVEVRLHDSGPSETAVLQVDVAGSFDGTRDAAGVLRWTVRLQSGKTVEQDIAVPGWVVDENGAVECWVGGQMAASVRLSGNQMGRAAFVAVLSDAPQAAQFLTGSSDGPDGLPVLPLAVPAATMPVQDDLMADLTAVVASPTELTRMDTAHQKALLHWVELGGLLVVTGTDPAVPDWNGVLPLLPGPLRKDSGQDLARFAGTASSPPVPVVVDARAVRAGADLWAGTDEAPLLAALHVGRGTVVQTGFEPAQSALLTWQNNPSLWTEVLSQGADNRQSALPPGLTANPIDSLASASSVLAPLRVPSLRLWGLVFALYIAVVGPGLFVLLRRLQAEPWAWAILPILSVVTTAVMYAVGLSQRPGGVLSDAVGVTDLVGDGTAETVSVRSFTAPYPEDVTLTAERGVEILPMVQADSRRVSSTDVVHGSATVIQLHNTGRWIVHDIVASGTVSGQGWIDLRLGAAQGMLSGTVENDTPYPLHDVAVGWNGHLYELGDLSPGQAVSMDHASSVGTAGSYLQSYVDYNRDLTRGIGRSLSAYAADMKLLASSPDKSAAVVMATTDAEAASGVQLVQDVRISTDSALQLVREFGDVLTFPEGRVRMQ
ncbi:MAG: hypothetical protein K6T78_02660 [Alicyclobacillus sp.]|nr:hypothetical protein [Alicyclobacillus sp.]